MVYRVWDKSKPPRGPFALNRDCPQAVGLVAWYPMGRASGKGQAFDLVGSRHVSGTVSGATLGDAGQPAQTLASASSHNLSVTAVPVTTFPLSIAAWFRPATASSGTVAGLASNSGASGFGRKLLFAHSDGSVRLYAQEGTSTSVFLASSGTYTTGQWTHGAAVFAGTSDYRAYRAGSNKATSTSTVAFGSPDRTRIGDDNTGGNYFNGDAGEVGFWNVALSDDLVWRLYDPGTRFELWYPRRSRKWFTQGSSSVSGTLSKSLGELTSSSAGSVAITGATSATLGTLTSSAAGAVAITGATSATLGSATLAATGQLALAGDVSRTLADATLSAAGAVALSASAVQTLEAASLSAAGTLALSGSVSRAMADATLSASGIGQSTTVGSLSATLADVASSSSGHVDIAATLGITLGDIVVSAVLSSPISASVSQALQDATLSSRIVLTTAGGAEVSSVGAMFSPARVGMLYSPQRSHTIYSQERRDG